MNPIITYLALLCALPASLAHAQVMFRDLKGQDISFTSLKGKWVFINYWASWCHSCLAEIPELNRFEKIHRNDPIALFAVNFDTSDLQEQKSLVQRFNINYPHLQQDPAKALQLGHIAGVPVTFVFNPQGHLVRTLYGEQTVKSLEKEIYK